MAVRGSHAGHVEHFSDPMVDCRACKARFRADHLVEQLLDASAQAGTDTDGARAGLVEGAGLEALGELITAHCRACPACGAPPEELTPPRDFNLMFETTVGAAGDGARVWLRPETAQGILINLPNVAASTRRKLPFGVGQVTDWKNRIGSVKFPTGHSRTFRSVKCGPRALAAARIVRFALPSPTA